MKVRFEKKYVMEVWVDEVTTWLYYNNKPLPPISNLYKKETFYIEDEGLQWAKERCVELYKEKEFECMTNRMNFKGKREEAISCYPMPRVFYTIETIYEYKPQS